MQPVINELLSQDFNVQLRHDPTETSWENVKEHGYVTILSKDGKRLAHRDGFQHNRKLRSGGSYDGAAVSELIAEATKAVSQAA